MLPPRQARYGALDCIVIDGGPSPRIAVILCHGYGAPGHDLAGIGPEWLDVLGDSAVNFRFVFPAAPHTLEELGMPEGRAWWPINMAALAQAIQADRFDELHDRVPPGIDEARQLLCQAIAEIRADVDSAAPLALGGFSQGAMLAMDASLRGDIDPPGVLIQFSGTVVCQSLWQPKLATRLSATRVYQSHGTIDPILPYSSATRLHELIEQAGIQSEFHSFMGPHTIDGESIVKTAMLLKEML